MTHPLDGAKAKVSRAREHLADLDRAVTAYLATDPVRVDHREERDGEERRIQWVATAASEPPQALGLLVGDWANNLRSSLDYTVYELVRRETGESDPRWTQFPVVTEARKYEASAAGRLRGVPAWSLPVFEGLQPFHDERDATDHHLAVLADVSNRDKHRLIHTAAMQIAGSQARVYGTGMKSISRLDQNPGSVVGERVILDAVLGVESDDFTIELDVAVDVALEGYEVPVKPLLAWVTSEVEEIVEWFADALG
jgi:hypothetical protein